MSAKNSDEDIRQYLPDLETIYREADPARAEEKHQQALDNPELDQALAELKQGLNAAEPAFQFPVVPAQPKGPAAPEATSPWATSPWASGAALTIDKAALPSSLAPAAVPPVAAPSTPAPTRAGAAHPRRWRTGIISALVAIAVLGPLTTWRVCSMMTTQVTEVSPAAPSSAMVAASASEEAVLPAAPELPLDADAGAGTKAAPRAPPTASAPQPPRTPSRRVPTAQPPSPSDEMMQ